MTLTITNKMSVSAMCACLTIVCGVAAAEGDAKVIEPRSPTDPLAGFSIREYKFARIAVESREMAIRECCDLLESRAQRKTTADAQIDIQVVYAAKLLSKLRPTDSQCIDALCKNVTVHPEVVVTRGSRRPLTPYPVAQALADIGTREVAEGILRRMKGKLDRKELLIDAHVLNLVDHRNVVLERMRIATERSRLEDPADVREVFADNLAQVKQWLDEPQFEGDDNFRP